MPTKNSYLLKIHALLVCLLVVQLGIAQNLVPNNSFEEYTSLPNGHGQWAKCKHWNSVDNTKQIGGPYATPDYFHLSAGSQVRMPNTVFGTVYPHSGEAVMGFCPWHSSVENFREYLTVKLLSPMKVGTTYRVSFWLTSGSAPSSYAYSSDHIGIQLSTSPLSQTEDEPIRDTPEIEIQGEVWEIEWKKYSFIFKADSSYSHLTFGNFFNDKATSTTSNGSISGGAYYFIDDVEVVANSLMITGKSSICLGDSIVLMAQNDIKFKWVNSLNTDSVLSTNSSLTVSPTITTTYLVFGSSDTASFTVDVNGEYPSFDFGKDTTLCEGETLLLDATIPEAKYLWQNEVSTPNFTISEEGTYWLKITLENCSASDTIEIKYTPLPIVSLGNDTTICIGSELLLDAKARRDNYKWNDNSTNQTLRVTEAGTYSVEVVQNNCKNVDEIQVDVRDCVTLLEIPNIFTPNADEINDQFVPIIAKGITSMHTDIYNRWGQKMFDTDSSMIEWDGQGANSGTYFWITHYVDFKGDEHTMTGTVTLIR